MSSWIPLAFLAACGAAPDAPAPGVEPEAVTEAAPPGVPDDAWIPVDGADWATNGHVMVRRDGSFPAVTSAHQGWRTDLDAEALRPFLAVPDATTTLQLVDTRSEDGVTVVRYQRASDQQFVHLDAAYSTVLTGAIVQGAGPLDPVYALDGSSAAIAVVMPRTIGTTP